MTPMLHHIQKSILNSLASAESLRYAEIKPRELDGNVFGYHLKQLLADKYVSKNQDGDYRLTGKGREYIVHRYEDPLLSAHTIFLIVVTSNNRYLLRERKVQPLLGMSGFVHGEPRPDEDVVLTARQRLLTKTGIDASPSVAGSALIAQYRDNELQSYTHAIVLTASTDADITITNDETGRNYWVDKTGLSNANVLPSTLDIISHLDQPHFFIEQSYHL